MSGIPPSNLGVRPTPRPTNSILRSHSTAHNSSSANIHNISATSTLNNSAGRLNNSAGQLNNSAGRLNNSAGRLNNSGSNLNNSSHQLNNSGSQLNNSSEHLNNKAQGLNVSTSDIPQDATLRISNKHGDNRAAIFASQQVGRKIISLIIF